MVKSKVFFGKWKRVLEHPLFIIPTAAFDLVSGIILAAAKSLVSGAFAALMLLAVAFAVSAVVAACRSSEESELSKAVEWIIAKANTELANNKFVNASKCFEAAIAYADTEQKLRIFMGLGDLHKKACLWKEAVENYNKAVAEGRYPWQAEIHLHMGLIHKDLLHGSEALAAFLKSAEIKEQFEAPPDEGTVTLYRLIAECYEKRNEAGDAGQAREWLQKEMAVRDVLLFAEDKAKAEALYSAANSHRDAQEYDKAKAGYLEALKILEPVLSEWHTWPAEIYQKGIAAVYETQENYEDAILYHKKALKSYERLLGIHLNTAGSYYHIGYDYWILANNALSNNNHEMAETHGEKAVEYLETALGLYEQLSDIEPSFIAHLHFLIGYAYKMFFDLKRMERANKHFQAALEYYEQHPDGNERHLAELYHHMGGDYYIKQDFTQAARLRLIGVRYAIKMRDNSPNDHFAASLCLNHFLALMLTYQQTKESETKPFEVWCAENGLPEDLLAGIKEVRIVSN
jgi:tetratricopeptide (TPR) repeat protein